MSHRSRSNTEESNVEVKQRFSTSVTDSDNRQYRSRIRHHDNGDAEQVAYYTPMSLSRRRRVVESPEGVRWYDSYLSLVNDTGRLPEFHTPTSSMFDYRSTTVAPRVNRWSYSEDSSDDTGAVTTKLASMHKNSRRDSSQSELRCGDHDDMKPDSECRRTTAGKRYYDGGRQRRDHHRSRKVSFDDATSSSKSESDESSERKHFMKAPKFDGSSMPFETFYAKF